LTLKEFNDVFQYQYKQIALITQRLVDTDVLDEDKYESVRNEQKQMANELCQYYLFILKTPLPPKEEIEKIIKNRSYVVTVDNFRYTYSYSGFIINKCYSGGNGFIPSRVLWANLNKVEQLNAEPIKLLGKTRPFTLKEFKEFIFIHDGWIRLRHKVEYDRTSSKIIEKYQAWDLLVTAIPTIESSPIFFGNKQITLGDLHRNYEMEIGGKWVPCGKEDSTDGTITVFDLYSNY
jgi:hypothetical protein